MALETFAGKFGGFLQVEVDDSRLMTSQVSVLTPPQMRSLEKPLKKIFKARLLGKVGQFMLG